MGFAYVISDQGALHFVTFTVHQWVDVFTRQCCVDELIESLPYCQKETGLEIFAWVIMSNHVHLILRAKNENLSDVIRGFKKFTAKKLYSSIKTTRRKAEAYVNSSAGALYGIRKGKTELAED